MNDTHYDVFISYSSKDLAVASELQGQLKSRCIRPWFDQREIDTMDIITEKLNEGLARADLVVALVSDHFLNSNPCRYEALTTFRRSFDDGVDRYSLIALGALPALWPALKGIRADTWTDSQLVSDVVAAALAQVRSITPRAAPEAAPPQFQVRTGRLRNFVGRFDSLLRLYAEALTEHANLDAGALVTQRKVALVGLGGMGKTAIAMKFAEDFAYAFPGGVVWLTAGGDDVRNRASGAVEQDLVLRKIAAQVQRWVHISATRLGLPLAPAPHPGSAHDDLHAAMDRAAVIAEHLDGTMLWIIDDLPAGMSEYLDDMACPARSSVTLITARNDLQEGGFESVEVNQLDVEDAVRLLKRGRREDYTWSKAEDRTLDVLAAAVGGHALAIDVMRARISRGVSPDDLLQQVHDLSGDLIEDEWSLGLPTGHAANIVRTLQASMVDLVSQMPDAQSVLLLLAVTPPEPRVWMGLVDATLTATSSRRGVALVISELVNFALLINDDEAQVEQENFIQVHAITRMVARRLLENEAAPLRTDPQKRRIVSVAAATWFAKRGGRLRNDDDLGAVHWYRRALVPLQDYESDPTIDERVIRAESLRGIARAEFRAPTIGNLVPGALDDPSWHHALELAVQAQAHIEEGLAVQPGDADLLLARAQALALHGIIVNQKADRLRRAGRLKEAREVNDEAIGMVREQIDIRQERATRIESGQAQEAPETDNRDLSEKQVQLARVDAARAWINLPGLLISRSKIHTAMAGHKRRATAVAESAAALNEADEIYRRILTRREEIFPPETRTTGQSLEIAACAYGIGAVAYVRGLLIPAPSPERMSPLAHAAATLAQSTRVRLAANTLDASKCIVLAAKFGLATRAGLEQTSEVPWNAWLAFADHVRPPAGETPPGLPDAEHFPGTIDELLELATNLAGDSRPDCGLSRDAAALAVLAVLDQLAGLDAADDPGDGSLAELAALATQLARAGLSWLALTEVLGVERAQTTDNVMTDWAEEGARWLPDTPWARPS